MALALSNRVQETATANTTVSFTLTGAVAGFQTFAAIGNTNTTYYSATDASGGWEVGLGTYSTTGPTLTRTTIYASSNAGSAVTFSGAVNVFVTYPSGRSVNLDASGNVSALGNVSSGVWQGSTVAVAYGGTGVTASSGPNSVVLRDADGNVAGVNNVEVGITFTTSAGGITTMTAASTQIQVLTGTANQTYKLPDATTLHEGVFYTFGNSSSGILTVTDNANAVIETITQGGAAQVLCLSAATVAGTWSYRVFASSNTTWGNAILDYPGAITNAEWNGDTISPAYGGTGLTTFAAANYALYSTGASTLTAGTLPVLAGGTGVTTSTGTGNVVLSTSPTLVTPALGTPASGNLANCTFPTLNQNTTGTAANVTGVVAFANGGTGQSSQQNAINALAGSVVLGSYLRGNGTNVVMASIQPADVPILNQNTTGTAANVTGTVAVANGGTGQTTYTDGQLLIGNSTGNTLTKATLSAGSGITITNGGGSINIAATGGGGSVTAVTGTSPVVSSGGTAPAISLAAGYGDTQNPYASKSANFVLAAPNGAAGVPTFRAVVAADIPTLNQSTTGSAGSVVNAATFNNGGAGGASGSTFNGSAALTVSYNTVGAPSTTGTGASGSWGISVTGTSANVTGTVALGNGGTGATTRQDAMDVLAGAVTSGQYLRGNGTDVVMSTIQAADVPTLNQNTTGSAATATTATNVSGGTVSSARINPRVSSTTSTSSIAPNISSFDQYAVTAQAVGLTLNAPIGTPVDGNKLMFRLLDNGTARALTWNATYTVIGVTLPATTVANKTTYVGCIYNANNTRWDVVAVVTQA